MDVPLESCPLCAFESEAYFEDAKRPYLQCRRCGLVFVPSLYWLSPEDEKARYDLHENDPADSRYRAFLSRLFLPLEERLKAGSRGLDFGCGPGPTLSLMLEEAGHTVALFDPFYASDPTVWDHTYDFITASEVVEHLHQPGRELERLWTHLRPGGWLALLTQTVLDVEAFSKWRYKEDRTHVAFFSEGTFRFLAETWGAELVCPTRDVAFLRKTKGKQNKVIGRK